MTLIAPNKYILATLMAMLAQSPAWAVSCTIDPAKFDFMSSSPQVFYVGTIDQVQSTYDRLARQLVTVESPERTKLFYTTASFSRISTSECEAGKCSGQDVMMGLQACAGEIPANPEMCYPLAAAYQGKLYCLLAPALDNYNAQRPFQEFNPYASED